MASWGLIPPQNPPRSREWDRVDEQVDRTLRKYFTVNTSYEWVDVGTALDNKVFHPLRIESTTAGAPDMGATGGFGFEWHCNRVQIQPYPGSTRHIRSLTGRAALGV